MTSGSFWRPFAAMQDAIMNECRIVRGEDVYVWDTDGKRYLDATASLWYANVGHGRKEIGEAVARQLRKLESYSAFGDFTNEPAEELASLLAARSPMEGAKVFFTLGGGEAVEASLKLSRQYWSGQGRPEKVHILSRRDSYHGTEGFGTSIAGIAANATGYGRLLPDVSVVDRDSTAAMEEEIDRLGSDSIAAIIVEPIIGAGGVYLPVDGYLERVAELCRAHDILFIVDAVICGFGRLGTWFGVERWKLSPDMILFAKGVTSGYLPLGGVVVAAPIARPFWSTEGPVFRHGPTYAGHPTCCAAGVANLSLLEKDDLVNRAQVVERDFAASLMSLAGHPLVTEVRSGIGLLGAIEVGSRNDGDSVSWASRAARAIREHGVLVRPLQTALAVSPPLTITVEQVEVITAGITKGLDDLYGRS